MNDGIKIVLSLSVSGSLLALILFAGKPLFKSKVSRAFSYYIWLLVLLRLTVPLAAPVNAMAALFHAEASSVSDVLPVQADGSAAEGTTGITGLPAAAPNAPQTAPLQAQQDGEAAPAQPSAETSRPFSLWGFIQSNLTGLWLAGAVVSFAWFSIAYIVFVRRLRRSFTAPHGDDLAVFERLRGGRRVRLFCSSAVDTPMFTGVLRPAVVLPQLAYVRNGMEEELRHILRHELTHYRRKDVLYKWLAVAVTSLHWFNPFMVLIRKEIGRACELSCDEAVVKDMAADERRFYGNMLLALAASRKPPAGILSTTLCEDGKALKERLMGIKNYKKRPARAAALTLVVTLLLTGCAATLGVANGGADGSSLDATVYARGIKGMEISYDAGHSYEIDETGRVSVSYNNGEDTAETPLTLNTSDRYAAGMEEDDTGFFISEAVTAIAYGGDDAPIRVLISRNMGKTWNTYPVEGSESMAFNKYIGFVTEDDGWLAASTGPAAGMSYNYVFRTADGGKTWTQTGDLNALYARNLTGAGFATADIAFLSFRVDSDPGPVIYRTQDGGATWKLLDVTVPEQFDYNTPLSPVFSGANGIYPIEYRLSSEDNSTLTYYLTSSDYGATWTYDADAAINEASSMSRYLTCTLPDTLISGPFDSRAGYLGGSLFRLKDTGSSIAQKASDSAGYGWNSYGGVDIYYNLDVTFDNGHQLTAVSTPWNHSWYLDEPQSLDRCATPALIVLVGHDLYTAAEAEEGNIPEEERATSMWYVFFAKEDSAVSYGIYLKAGYYSRNDAIALARSVQFEDGAFNIQP